MLNFTYPAVNTKVVITGTPHQKVVVSNDALDENIRKAINEKVRIDLGYC